LFIVFSEFCISSLHCCLPQGIWLSRCDAISDAAKAHHGRGHARTVLGLRGSFLNVLRFRKLKKKACRSSAHYALRCRKVTSTRRTPVRFGVLVLVSSLFAGSGDGVKDEDEDEDEDETGERSESARSSLLFLPDSATNRLRFGEFSVKQRDKTARLNPPAETRIGFDERRAGTGCANARLRFPRRRNENVT
jgi:hypothetical protein